MSEIFQAFTYRWGFGVLHLPRRYGIGFEVHFNGRFLIGVRIGSYWFSYGQQIARSWADYTFWTTTATRGGE